MNWKDSKYLLAYLAPLSTFAAIYVQGYWSFATVILAFAIIPLLDHFYSSSEKNLTEQEEGSKLSTIIFDWLLYSNIPILWGLIWFFFSTISAGGLETFEMVGMTWSIGIIVSTIGINVAHELGHRVKKSEQLMSKSLLLSALYMHFFIEHNKGHHKNIATDEDPASSRLNENLYAFWVRSTIGGYKSAWSLETAKLKKQGVSFFSFKNEMLVFQLVQVTYLVFVGLYFGWFVVPFAIIIAITGFLLLETVNYIEHYGLRRKKLASGRYENVTIQHSWNSNHEMGRIFLYELTRHSDHHFKSTRKFQVLRHFDDSPQLPYGYPGSMLISFLPPLWFKLMNDKVPSALT
ncbi:MAG: alkane 1-monooxygenase [Saprospiraceae bacterium]|jgi:alkane 1-monooxygenase|nr:alkane 1-monooxygenase [Saprospiraceae bacterium]MDB4539155.1 alkane 1-monooxygenase [Saprospiraceae bacterium]MDC3210431.1 alkane 1-monooxygenase [Saprospiraceae bacterium]MDG1432396.1 alkane 1-monooxygenase [Saprospiraceae bacterium]MDG2419261.1 alkane 1-monooxygenase [Saprospiraceae bacterium]